MKKYGWLVGVGITIIIVFFVVLFMFSFRGIQSGDIINTYTYRYTNIVGDTFNVKLSSYFYSRPDGQFQEGVHLRYLPYMEYKPDDGSMGRLMGPFHTLIVSPAEGTVPDTPYEVIISYEGRNPETQVIQWTQSEIRENKEYKLFVISFIGGDVTIVVKKK